MNMKIAKLFSSFLPAKKSRVTGTDIAIGIGVAAALGAVVVYLARAGRLVPVLERLGLNKLADVAKETTTDPGLPFSAGTEEVSPRDHAS
jgi:hypothetical protein